VGIYNIAIHFHPFGCWSPGIDDFLLKVGVTLVIFAVIL